MSVVFDHEKLDVYQVELEFIAWVTPLMAEVRGPEAASTAEVRNQLDRASISVLLNTAEGNGKRSRRMRAKFFDDARGSGMECAACLDTLVAKKACTRDRIMQGKELLHRVVSMLTKLVELFDDRGLVREDSEIYRDGDCAKADIEHDHDYEHEYDRK